MKYAEVILPLPLEGTFTYAVPDTLADKVGSGVRVLVPLGKSKTYTGIVASLHDRKPDFDVRDVISAPDGGSPMLLPEQLRLWQWIADYYMAPVGDVYKAALPSGLKAEDGYRPKTETFVTLAQKYRSETALHVALDMLARAPKQHKVLTDFLSISHWGGIESGNAPDDVREISREELTNVSRCTAAVVRQLVSRGFLTVYEREVGRLNVSSEPDFGSIKKLSLPQQDAYNAVLMQWMKHNVVLLHGVTSSGKTEIYIHLIRQALERHEQVLYLLPEIALTVQIMERLQKVFGNRLGIYHSKYSDAERVEIWRKQLSGNPYDVILGARSAVFLPFQKLGLVIIDEEHETSFKQQDPAPRYHARSAAIMLAGMYGAKTLLGTATPSAESYYNAKQGKYGYVRLSTRYKDIELPEIRVVDVKDLRHRKIMRGPFSPPLIAAMREVLDSDRQIILFQNRRGFAPMIECRECGWVPKCQNCDVSLTYHKNTGMLTCHYCGFTYRVPTVCPNCGSTELKGVGYGTEKIEDQISNLFPDARVARMDLDTTRTRNAYSRIIGDFARGKTNVLVGTQMISKGLDFDRVGLVGILDADLMLNYPDFRAHEHAFMMMSQVAGRAGRKGKRGLVILQTKDAASTVIRQVVDNDYEGFFNDMIAERRLFHYPPFFRLVYVYLRHTKAEIADTAGIEFGSRLRQWFGQRVLGPDKPAVAKVKTLHIRKLVLKLENGIDLRRVRQYLRLAQQQMLTDKRYSTIQIYYDVDPL